jgi:type IV fimbrial biogenesis protein FimT
MIDMFGRSNSSDFTCASRAAGFTIVELMVTVTLFAITMALALPSYQESLDKRRLSSATEQLEAFVNFGQLEATRRNEPITLSYDRNAHDDWCVGLIVGNTACDCMETVTTETDFCDVDDVPRILGNADFGDAELVHIIEGNNSLTFDPIRGILLDATDVMTIELHTDSRDYQVNLMVNATGDVTLCSKDANHDLPGYTVCPAEAVVLAEI